MRINRILQGLVWAWRIGRVNRGHLAFSLISAASLFLLLLTLTPAPTPDLHRLTPHMARRIQQQNDDYTGPKHTAGLEDTKNNALNTGHKVRILLPEKTDSPTGSEGVQTNGGNESPSLSLQPVSPNSNQNIDRGIGQVEQIRPKLTDRFKTTSVYPHLTPSHHKTIPPSLRDTQSHKDTQSHGDTQLQREAQSHGYNAQSHKDEKSHRDTQSYRNAQLHKDTQSQGYNSQSQPQRYNAQAHKDTQSQGYNSQSQGYNSQSQGYNSQSQGYNSQSQGYNSQSQGYNSQSQGYNAQSRGYNSQSQPQRYNPQSYTAKTQNNVQGFTAYSQKNIGQSYRNSAQTKWNNMQLQRNPIQSQRNTGESEKTILPADSIREAQEQLALDIPRNAKETAQILSAQDRAMAALQHGYKITQQQKHMLSKLTPQSRAQLQMRNMKQRKDQDRTYLQHLRGKHQIMPRKGGGEEIYSNSRMIVRFPALLKMNSPKDWEPLYNIFANLTHRPWVQSQECNNYTITFYTPSSHSTRALASFPSSGNTWIRYLIEGATGIFTGSLYDDTSLTRRGLYGEGVKYDSGMTVVQKSHGYTTGEAMSLPHQDRLNKNHMAELSYQGIIVIRNPFKALISHRHLDVGGHTGYAPKAHFVGPGWASFITLKIELWKDFYLDWITRTQSDKIHITHYENLKDDPVGEMRKILTYLGLTEDKGRLECLGKHTDGLFKRKPSKQKNLDTNPFTKELKDLIYEAIENVNRALVEAGKEELPLDKYEYYDQNEANVAKYQRKN